MPDEDEKITIQSVTSPAFSQRVDRAKYTAMRDALLAVLPVKVTHRASHARRFR